MQAHFGIIAGLCLSIAACGNGNADGLYLTDSSSALGCRGRGTTCADVDGGAGSAPHRSGGHDREADAGDPSPETGADGGVSSCHEDEDCPDAEVCERHHGEGRCQAEHDSSGPGSGHAEDGDDHSADAGTASHDEDRSGSNSGRH